MADSVAEKRGTLAIHRGAPCVRFSHLLLRPLHRSSGPWKRPVNGSRSLLVFTCGSLFICASRIPLKELVYSEYCVALFNKVKIGSAAYSQQFHSVRASGRSCPWRALISCIFLQHSLVSWGNTGRAVHTHAFCCHGH